MSLRSVVVGHADSSIDRAVLRAIRSGVNLARPIPEEFYLAELLNNLVPSAEMVKFGKNGSDATAGAVRLARAATGRPLIVRSSADPFLGVHDWFIGSTVMDRGVPEPIQGLTKIFKHDDLQDLERILQANASRVAGVIIEPASNPKHSPGYLEGVRELAKQHGALLIFDETVSGFRFHLSGAQKYFGVTPDLSTFGKGIANGYPLSALVGKREYMELGGLTHPGKRVFLMSSTYGSERVGLAAGIQTISVLQKRNGIHRLWAIGGEVKRALGASVASNGLSDFVSIGGYDCSPTVTFLGEDGGPDLALKTLFMEEMLRHRILLSSNLFSPALAHSPTIMRTTAIAIEKSIFSVAKAVRTGNVSESLQGRPIKVVFRAENGPD
jgi:glutamate-1-semialdehyde 2,1-aminomutase